MIELYKMHPVENAEADRLRVLRDDGKDDRHGRRRRSRGIYTEKNGPYTKRERERAERWQRSIKARRNEVN